MIWGNFSPKALDFIKNSESRLNITHGSVRSSKTINVMVRWLRYIVEGPPGSLVMTGKTRTTLQRNVLNDLEETVGSKRFKWSSKADGLFSVYGRKIYAVGANDEKAEGKLRGATFAGAVCDEVSLYPESFFKQLLARVSVTNAKIFVTTNPDSPYHWFNRDFIENDEIKNKKIWHFNLDDNLNLSEEYKTSLKQEYSGVWRKRMIDGLWVQAEGAIYDMFDERRHVIDEAPGTEFDREFIACDYGTSNPCVFLKMAKKGNLLYVLDEYYFDSREQGRQKTDSEYAADLLAFTKGRYYPIIVDPSAASFILELERKGLSIERADNSVLDGIRLVASMLAQGKLFIVRKCENTIKEFYSYVWDPKAQQRGEDAPLKESDHGLDCCRYGAKYAFDGNNITTFRIKY